MSKHYLIVFILFIFYFCCSHTNKTFFDQFRINENVTFGPHSSEKLPDYLMENFNASLENDYNNYTTAEFSSNEDLSSRANITFGKKLDFYGKVVLISGANSGLGKAIAIHFAKLGATLSLTGKNFSKLYSAYKVIRKVATVKPHIPCGDLKHHEFAEYIIRYTINRFGKLDVLVNNAGIYEFGSIENTTAKQLDRLYKNNVRSMYSLTLEAVPYLAKTNGTIINVSSLAGLRPFKNILAYCMSKAAVDQFTKCLALELGPKNIRVNSVNPSVIDTGLHLRSGMDEVKYRQYINNSASNHILGRITTVEDVAKAVAFLASDEASFITGVNFPVDGGRSILCR